MGNGSVSAGKTNNGILRLEELEERIAPVIVTADPHTWLQPGGFDGWSVGQQDNYWIFYIGPGQAHILSAGGSESIVGDFLGDITIENSTDPITHTVSTPDLSSGLFILSYPTGSSQPPQTAVLPRVVNWPIQAGTMIVEGRVESFGSIGCIEVDGLLDVSSSVEVHGTLGRLDVGVLNAASVHASGDIYEIDVDTLIGSFWDSQATTATSSNAFSPTPVTIAADGNIGAIRAGVGLTDRGHGVTTTSVLGGAISGLVTIRANADNAGAPGVIDLIESRAGSMFAGSLGTGLGDTYPMIGAGPGGNVRFVYAEGPIYWGGGILSETTVTSGSPALLRTIVDDSGGVMTIHPLDQTFVDPTTGASTTYPATVSYAIIQVNPFLEGPGAVVVRLTADGSNAFSVTGSVDVGEVRFGPTTTFAVIAQAEDPGTYISSVANLTQINQIIALQGLARDVFHGSGKTDIYFLNAMATHGGPSGIIPIVLNNTIDGDILSVGADTQIAVVSANDAGGDIGATEGVSPWILRGPLFYNDGDVLWVDISTTSPNINPFGVEGSIMRSNSIYGVYCGGEIWGVRAGGAIGDVRSLGGAIHLVQADSNNMRDPGSPLMVSNVEEVSGLVGVAPPLFPVYPHPGAVSFFGKIQNTLGDGIFGRVSTGPSASAFPDSLGDGFNSDAACTVGIVRVGEGLEPTTYVPFEIYDLNFYPSDSPYTGSPGVFVNSGVYAAGAINRVTAVNTSADNAVGHDRGIFGDVIGQGGVSLVDATNGAVIDGPIINATDVDARIPVVSITVTGNIGTVESTGHGGGITDVSILGNSVDRVITSGGTTGISHVSVTGFSGSINTISADGPGIINNCFIQANGTCNKIETTTKGGVIQGGDIEISRYLGTLDTDGLEGSFIDVVTIGHLGTFDHISDSLWFSGAVNKFTVTHDVTGSSINVAGPLDSFNIGGSLVNTTVAATGPFGDIHSLRVTHGIRGSLISTSGSLSLVQTTSHIDGNINATISAAGNQGSVRIISAKNASGTWVVNNDLALVSVYGNLNADILAASSGTISAGGAINGIIDVTGSAGTIAAKGSIRGDITVGADLEVLQSSRAILGNIDVAGELSSAKSAGDFGLQDAGVSITTLQAGKLGSLVVGSGTRHADILSDVSVTGNAGTISAAGAFQGDIMVGGNLSTLKTGGAADAGLAGGQVRVDGNVGQISIGGSATHASLLSDVGIGGNLGSLKVAGDFAGSLAVGNVNLPPRLRAGDVGSIVVKGSMGDTGAGTMIDIAGKLSSMTVGTTADGGDLLSSMVVHRNVGSVTVAGNVAAPIHVVGSTSSVSVGGDVSDEATALANPGFDFLQFDGNLGTLKMRGDDWGDILVGGNAGNILSDHLTGRIIANVTIAGNLGSFDAGGTSVTPVELVPPVHDWTLSNVVGAVEIDTTLHVDGTAGKVI